MEIIYLTSLKDNPVWHGHGMDFPNRPISVQEIMQLEQLYNNGNPFPRALKELLYLAGSYCRVLDYGTHQTQGELQEFIRKQMHKVGHIVTRPFYIIDVYNGGDTYLLVYLDEGDDPAVYEGLYEGVKDDIITPDGWTILVNESLSGLITRLIAMQ